MMKTGRIIKDLRKKQDVTQEKLAAYLNISYQAISKWENGTALPDITLIPQIANFFGVTSDELLGMKDSVQSEELKEYENTYQQNNRDGRVLDNINLASEVLKKYPRNYQWMLNLAYPLTEYTATKEQTAYAKENNFLQKAIDICERILEDCTVDSIRHSAIQILCCNYPLVGKADEAVALAQTMPDIWVCKEELLSKVYSGEKQLMQLQRNVVTMIDLCFGSILLYASLDNGLTEYNKIELMQTASSLLRTVIKDGDNILLYNDRLMRSHFEIAAMYAKLEEYPKALESILICEKYAAACDRLKNSGAQKCASLLTDRIIFDPKDNGKTWEGSWKQLLLCMIGNNPHIGKLKDNDDFTALIERLRISA